MTSWRRSASGRSTGVTCGRGRAAATGRWRHAASNTIRALEFFRNTLPRHQRELKLRRQFSARSSDAVEAVDLQPLSREAAPKMLRMLELGMRKAGAGAAGLADSPLARGPDDRETRFGTRSEWADFADFATERKGKHHAYERAKAEKAMAESGDGWRPGAHDEALDSLLDRRRRRRPDRDARAGADARGDF